MNQRERRIATLTGAVLGLGLLWTQAIDPALAAFQAEGERLEGLRTLVGRERELCEQLEQKRQERAALAERLAPDTDGAEAGAAAGFAAFVRGLSRAAGFEPGSLRFVRAQALAEAAPQAPGKPPAASPFAELRFELRARTSLGALQKFLVQLTAAERPVRVVAMGVAPRSDSTDLDVDLTLLALAPREALREEAPR